VKVIVQQQFTSDRVTADCLSLHPSKEAKWWANDRVGVPFHETAADLDKAIAVNSADPRLGRSGHHNSALELGNCLGH